MNKYIAFLDILGFKDIVFKNTHESLEQKYKELFSPNVAFSLSNGKFNTIKQDGKRIKIPDNTEININSLVISDSVICWTNDTSTKSFIDIIVIVRNMLARGLAVGMPFRGGISIGPLSYLSYKLNSNTENKFESLFGKGFVDAYLLESLQQWSGCIVAEEAIAKYIQEYQKGSKNYPDLDLASIDYLIEVGLIVKYNVPYKEGSKSHTVINWPRNYINIPPTEDNIRKSFEMHNKSIDNSSVSLKINNTVKFFNDMLSNA